ncbi:NADH:ubiquinone oxidoreductase subunit 6 (subunit J) [Orbus hercynius]|uniref:NADH-quinone oxidoreductase subunit J n=1 Tax=Orbus hercynius TaxID=593135 RepID=A0A495REV7_9GAMM|nr:NADH-quinone oxidoreductase subunit J [Orbus hercynius]RKS85736.1 NADH:ubiquinone oxidoreductase subunit 6 (subunit J) [Orbus hercynius]
MVSIFYIAAIITVLASIKAISSTKSMSALLYFVISLLATSVVFFIMGAYFSAALIVVLFIGAVSLLFLSVLSLINLRKDMVEQNKHGISPKIWLGPLILVFVLFVTLIYGIASNDYSALQTNHSDRTTLTEMFLGPYILVIELAILLLLCGLVIAYHFIYRLYIHKESHSLAQDDQIEEQHDSTNA